MEKIIVLFLFFISFVCAAQENGTFTVSKGQEKVTLVLDTKLPYIEFNKPVVFETYYENMDLKQVITIARNLKKTGKAM